MTFPRPHVCQADKKEWLTHLDHVRSQGPWLIYFSAPKILALHDALLNCNNVDVQRLLSFAAPHLDGRELHRRADLAIASYRKERVAREQLERLNRVLAVALGKMGDRHQAFAIDRTAVNGLQTAHQVVVCPCALLSSFSLLRFLILSRRSSLFLPFAQKGAGKPLQDMEGGWLAETVILGREWYSVAAADGEEREERKDQADA